MKPLTNVDQNQSVSKHMEGERRAASNGLTVDFPTPGGPETMRTFGTDMVGR